MPIVVVFLIFVVCLVIAIPVSISLGIVSVLPGAFDPSFTASAQFYVWWNRQFSTSCSADVCALRNRYGKGWNLEKAV